MGLRHRTRTGAAQTGNVDEGVAQVSGSREGQWGLRYGWEESRGGLGVVVAVASGRHNV